MTNKPLALTRDEIREIAQIKNIREMWGAENVADMEAMLDTDVYAVKFNYHSGGPGYAGDYFILQGDALGEALELIRDNKGELFIIDPRTL
jgi:hypothetical protein